MDVSIDAMRDAQSDQRSTAGGPNTQEGKEVVRWNAVRHGISSPKPVIPGLQHRAKRLASYARRTISTQQSALWLPTAES